MFSQFHPEKWKKCKGFPPAQENHKFSPIWSQGSERQGQRHRRLSQQATTVGLLRGGHCLPSISCFCWSRPAKDNLATCLVVIIMTLLHLVRHDLCVGLSAGEERCWTADRSTRPSLATLWPSSSALLSLVAWSQHHLVVGQWQHIPCCALASSLLLTQSKSCHLVSIYVVCKVPRPLFLLLSSHAYHDGDWSTTD